MTYNRRIVAVRIGRMTIQRSNSSTVYVRIDEAPLGTIIIPAAQVVQPRFLIEDITAIAKRIAHTQRVRKRAGRAQRLTPCIVLVFYYKIASAVKNADDVALEILDIGINRAVESNFCRTGLGVVEEMEHIGMLNFVEVSVRYFHMRHQLAVIGVIRRFGVPAMLQHLLNTHTVVVVLEGEGLSFAGHFLELATNRPFIRPTTIIQRIADLFSYEA